MAALQEEAEPGAHAPYVGGASVVALALGIPVLISMLALAIAPGVLQMAQEFGALTAQLVLTLPAVVMIVGAALAGYLSEHWGRRAVIAACLVVYAVAGVSGGLAPSLTMLVIARVVSGFVGGVLLTSVYAVIGEYFEGSRRESILGFMSTAASIASLALLVVMGFVVERFGWRAPFMLYGLSLLLLPCALKGLHRGLSAASISLSWRPVLRGWPFYLLLTGYTVGMYMMVIQGPFLMAAKGFAAPSTIGQFIGLSSLVGALCSAFYGMMRRWLDFRQMFILISLAIGVGLPLAAWAPGGGWIVLSMVVVGIGIGIIEPTVASELLLRTPEPLHDRAMGVNVAAMFLGQFLNPLLLAPVREAYGIAFAFTVVGLVYLLAAGLFAASLGRRPVPLRADA
jgi:MFS family permease